MEIIYYCSVGQIFGSGLEHFWLRAAHEVSAKCLFWKSSEGLSWAGESTSKWFNHKAIKLVLAVGGRPQPCPHGALHRTA